jgi:hypothetical protein
VLNFLLDAPVENMYATLVGLRVIQEFSTNKTCVEILHQNKELIERCLEAKKAKDAYKESENKKA